MCSILFSAVMLLVLDGCHLLFQSPEFRVFDPRLFEDPFYRATTCNATHGIAVAILSVRLSDACIVTKLNEGLQIFSYHTKRQSL